MSKQSFKKSSQIGFIVLLPLFILVASFAAAGHTSPNALAAGSDDNVMMSQPLDSPQQQICDCSADLYDCENFESQEVAQACFDYCQRTADTNDIHNLDADANEIVCEGTDFENLPPTPTPEPEEEEEEEEESEEEVPGSNNLVFNGNFEFGFYPVPELGFEAPDVGQVPIDWNWFKNKKYGKYTINNNEGFGLVCPDDLNLGTVGKNSLSIHIQSTDEADARLGIYQTINVVPGLEYLFSISGTIQVQPGGSSPDINHHMLLYFDDTGNTNWQAIPHEDWTVIPWREQELEFEISGPDDPDIASIEDYFEVVRPTSNKLTIFLMGWRRWANWRTGIFTLDCVSLVPLNSVDAAAIVPRLSEISVTTVDEVLEASSVEAGAEAAPEAEPAVVSEEEETATTAPETEQAVIPPSGGILDSSGNALLVVAASIILILSLVGAGIWSIRRQR